MRDYIGCNPLDALGLVPHAVYRLTFVPQNALFPDWVSIEEWGESAQTMLERIGQSRYLYAIQGAPSIEDTDKGRAAVIDCMAQTSVSATPIQTAAEAVEDVFSYAKLVRVERRAPLTQRDVEKRPAEQAQSGAKTAEDEAAKAPGLKLEKYAKWGLIALALVAAIIVVPRIFGKKAPESGE